MNPQYRYNLPQDYHYGGGGDTSATAMAVIVLVVGAILILILPRRYVVIPLLVAGCLVPLGNAVVVAGLNFNATRLLLGVGMIRLLREGGLRTLKWNRLDRAVLFGLLWSAACYVALWHSTGALINRLGYLWTGIGAYLMCRFAIREEADALRTIRVLAWLICIIAPPMLYEHATGWNPFSLLGAPAASLVRYDGVRAQGPFAHPIIAGTLAMSVMPILLTLWNAGGPGRGLAVGSACGAAVIAMSSASSTPLMTGLAAVAAVAARPLRSQMRSVIWGVLLSVVFLQAVMATPIWFLMARVSSVLGGHGYHRAMLIDNSVRHFAEWWFIGTTQNPDWGFSMWDVDNAFVKAGLTGGVLGLYLFVRVIVLAYGQLGRAMRVAAPQDVRLLWGIGASLFATTVGFLGITYFDQSILWWYALLAIIQLAPTWGRSRSKRATNDVWPDRSPATT